MKNIAILASGNGSNAENIYHYFKEHAHIAVKLFGTNNKNAFVIERAKNLGVPCVVFSAAELKESEVLLNTFSQYKIDFIVLAGFLLCIPEKIIQAFPKRIVNIHPALLPKFGGKGMYGDNVHRAVIQSGEKETGITIHYVNEKYDEGEIIFQARCRVEETDTPETIAQKVHELEYRYYPEVIEKIIMNIRDCLKS